MTWSPEFFPHGQSYFWIFAVSVDQYEGRKFLQEMSKLSRDQSLEILECHRPNWLMLINWPIFSSSTHAIVCGLANLTVVMVGVTNGE